ncbi:MAG TPA: 3-deoxy-manno-octulosonate cytidylyltransferase [Bacteroidota bacterium]|nr:3-deoxy-manno-octulosonate cytidylyltransferase [Bacteroidota bacterium]
MGNPVKVIGIIPARYGSTRLKAKPLADICGKPMIQHVAERARKARCLSDVLVATDDERVVAAVKNFGGHAVMTPQELRSGTDRIAFAAKGLAGADLIVNIQGDEPLIAPEMIDATVEPLLRDASIRAGTAAKQLSSEEELRNPSIVKVVMDSAGNALYFSRSPIPYLRDGGGDKSWTSIHTYYKHFGIYVFRREFLIEFSGWSESALEKAERLEQLRILEHGVAIRVTLTDCESVAVDTPEDLEMVRSILRKQLSAKNL